MMRKKAAAILLFAALGLGALAEIAHALDYPHNEYTNDIECNSCHDVHSGAFDLLPREYDTPPQNIDDTPANNLCWSCHNDVVAPYVKTHSSLTTDNDYGDWTVECKTCHDPHQQMQFTTYGVESYLYSGAVSVVAATTLTVSNAGWTPDQFKGLVVIPNTNEDYYNYKIAGNTSDTLTIDATMNLDKVTAGDTLAIIYGKLIESTIPTPNSGEKEVRFFRGLGAHSFSDGDATYDGVCEVCHTQTAYHRNNSSGDHAHNVGTSCTQCHQHKNGFRGMGGGAHGLHLSNEHGPQLTCTSGNLGCHGGSSPPLLSDNQDLANTSVCDDCHSADGAATAKQYWDNPGSAEGTAGSWAAVEGELAFCGSCHDSTPGNTQIDGSGSDAPNVMGDGSTYGFSVTGHGNPSGYYARLSWQAVSATGNPAANRQCSSCHDLTSKHFNNASERLRAGYENDNNNSNCKQCHDPGTVAMGDPQWYTTYTSYQNSAHHATKCSECHDVHGASGAFTGMTKAADEALCLQCHASQSGHALGVQFGKDGKTYSLECTSCHNVHVITGMYTVSEPNRSPVTKFSNNTEVWGDETGEKMDDFAGSGTYRTPNGDTFSGAQLPDYVSFCLDCHGVSQSEFGSHGGISWGSSEPHGLHSANVPNGGGVVPDWYTCGKAVGWDGDDATGSENDCWPVMTRGKGEQIWSRGPYNQEERIAGANFVLSCTDCHVTHESGIGSKLRATVNAGAGSTIWNTMCNNCHYYYSTWHAGMSCGNASCHQNQRIIGSNSIHGIDKNTGASETRGFDPSLVVDMRFENNLNDSGSWRLHGVWRVSAGSFTAGVSGNAVEVNDDPIEVGTRDEYWSTDEGKHGTWKYTEMKYQTTLEAWVYPTDDSVVERKIMAKHTYQNGGYALVLRKIGGSLRAAFTANVNGGGEYGVWDADSNGLRGAYSTVGVPLNQWTHIAATFDTNGPDRDPNDLSVGRVRVYVNGEDVTTSYPNDNQTYCQPGPGEDTMFPYSAHSFPEDSDPASPLYHTNVWGYDGHWCASALSIGGLNWSAPDDNFIGRLDEVKIWNITKDAAYFETVDAASPPRIDKAESLITSDELRVTFSEGVYANAGQSGGLEPSDFSLTDADNGRTILSVSHAAGAATAILTLSSPFDDADDIGVDTLAAAANSIYDEYDNPAGADPVTIMMVSACPTGQTSFQLNESAGSAYILDEQKMLLGAVNDPSESLLGDGFFHGDGVDDYIDFESNNSCLQASTMLTMEARIKPTGIGAGNYIKRIFARDSGNANYQVSVWRNVNWATYNPPDNVASIALWVKPTDAHGGKAWKPVLTDYDSYPILSDHWYKVKVVWNSSKTGGIPCDIFVDDQGTDGNGAGENWTGYKNATDSDQSQLPTDRYLQEGDEISTADGDFTIGCNVNNHANNVFNGLIDWITWQAAVDYSGVDNPP